MPNSPIYHHPAITAPQEVYDRVMDHVLKGEPDSARTPMEMHEFNMSYYQAGFAVILMGAANGSATCRGILYGLKMGIGLPSDERILIVANHTVNEMSESSVGDHGFIAEKRAVHHLIHYSYLGHLFCQFALYMAEEDHENLPEHSEIYKMFGKKCLKPGFTEEIRKAFPAILAFLYSPEHLNADWVDEVLKTSLEQLELPDSMPMTASLNS